MAVAENSTFPEFGDGDVLIVISGSRQYRLHSQLLRNHSIKMRELLTDEYGPPLTNKSIKKGITVRYRLELAEKDEDDEDSGHMTSEGNTLKVRLEPVHMNGEGRPVDGRTIELDLENGMEINPIHEVRSLHHAFSHRH